MPNLAYLHDPSIRYDAEDLTHSYIHIHPSTSRNFAVDLYYDALLGYPSTSASNPVFHGHALYPQQSDFVRFCQAFHAFLNLWMLNAGTSGGESALASKAPPSLPEELIADHAALLTHIYGRNLWSWRELEEILGSSHTNLQRIAKRESKPSHELGKKILDLHRFIRRLEAVTNANTDTMKRTLECPNERSGRNAQALLREGNFKKAFSAVMDAVSPRLPAIEPLPLLWYDEPSRAIWDDEPTGDEQA